MRERLVRLYKLRLPSWFSLDDFIEMMRYSQDSVLKVLQENPYVLLMKHERECEDVEHYVRSRKFFETHILGRWRSFGCEVEEVPE